MSERVLGSPTTVTLTLPGTDSKSKTGMLVVQLKNLCQLFGIVLKR
jgi:hypothetical protein